MGDLVPKDSPPDITLAVKEIILQARTNIATTVNRELLSAYWQIGKLISTRPQSENLDKISDRTFMLSLSKNLTDELGRGFSRSNLINMKKFYENYADGQTVSDRLSWSHYCELLAVSDIDARSFYEKECLNSLPDKEQLIKQVEYVLSQNDE